MKKQNKLLLFYIGTITAVILSVHWGSRAVTVLSENLPVQRTHRIIIDAGHGGEDGGATSCTGKLESAFNLEISLRLNDLLHLMGYDTVMIRTSDISVYTKGESLAQKKRSDLKERVRIANETPGGLLLSIHQNHFPDNQYSGAQIFYAATENSDRLAQQMQTAFIRTLNPGSNRQCKKSNGIYLMDHINCPGILIECGFLSNKQEEAKLRTREYQQKLCCVIASSVDAYLSNT